MDVVDKDLPSSPGGKPQLIEFEGVNWPLGKYCQPESRNQM